MDSAVESQQAPNPSSLPAHVPPELVRDYPFASRGATMSILPRTLIPGIQSGAPIFWAEGVSHQFPGAWVPRRYADIAQIYMDTDHFTPGGSSGFGQLIGENWISVPSETDPPLHSKYRMLLNPMFSPARIAKLEEKIRVYARERLEELAPLGACDFVADFAFEFPIRVFLELMGLPQEQVKTFLEWEHGILRSQSIEPVAKALRQVTDYLVLQCEDRRQNPRDDLLTLAVEAEIDGRKLNEDELKGICFNLFVGGLDTVSTNMSNQFRHLAENPKDQKFLRENPAKISDAIDELMRAYAAVTTLRVCKADKEVAGVQIKVGDLVLMPTHLAANDPEMFPNPEAVDFTRRPRHLSFGYGPHVCIGLHLARREMKIAMEEALAVLPEFSIKPGTEIVSFCSGIIGPRELPLVWQA